MRHKLVASKRGGKKARTATRKPLGKAPGTRRDKRGPAESVLPLLRASRKMIRESVAAARRGK
jgi:hypothetical protein